MSKFVIFILLCCFAMSETTASAQRSGPTPPRYYEDPGACPFECCTYRRWTVTANTLLYQSRSNNSPVVFRVKKGEHVTGLTGVVITLKPGKALVKKDGTLEIGGRGVQVKAGEILYLLHYQGEGFYKFWLRGRIYEAEMPFAPDLVYQSAEEKKKAFIQQLSEPQTVWWVKVKNSRGQIGWSKQDEHFGDMDACA